jgi:hypothetical protein
LSSVRALVQKKGSILKSIFQFLVLVLVFLVVSCSSDVQEKEGNEAFQFDFNAVRSTQNFSLPFSETWNDISMEGQYNFITCIRDGMFFGAASYEDFRITFGDRPSQVVTADQQGCIAWTENIIYNSFSEMRFWELTVRIEGIGRFKGYRDIPVLFNPWSGNLLDPRYDDIDEIPDYAIVPMSSVFSVAEAQVMGFMPDTENLRMDKVNIFVHEIYNFDDRAEVDAEVQLTPQFFVRDENGVPEYKNFTSGKFLLRAALVEYIVGEEHVIPIATYDEVADLRVEDKGTIRFRSRFELEPGGRP